MDGQAGLRLCCSQTPEDRFSPVEAHITIDPGRQKVAENDQSLVDCDMVAKYSPIFFYKKKILIFC